MESAIPAPAIRLEIPIQGENVSRIQLLGELNQARIGEELDTGDILTLDRDFESYRWRRNRPFHLLVPLDRGG